MQVYYTRRSENAKTGNIPQSYMPSSTCPPSCPLMGSGCYAGQGHTGIHWRKLDAGLVGMPWEDFLLQIKALPRGQLWRHGVAGDLPGEGEKVDPKGLRELTAANRGRKGFAYTHKNPRHYGELFLEATLAGFTVNLSADNLAEVDEFRALAVGPVVTVLPAAEKDWPSRTPAGHRVVVCPAVTHPGVTCDSCRLCQVASRSVVVGFPSHGNQKKKAEAAFFAGS